LPRLPTRVLEWRAMFAAEVLSEIQEPELIDGVRVRKVSPKLRHATVQLTLGMILRRCAQGRGKVATEWRCLLESGRSELVPDVSFVSNERLAPLSTEEREMPPFAPDVAVEVRSPKDKHSVLSRKSAVYRSHGCLLVLDVDPQTRTIRALEGDSERAFSESERFASAALPWLVFEVRAAFEGLDESA